MTLRRLAMTAGGLGLAPFASGTFGSAGACVIALAAWAALGAGDASPAVLAVTWVVLTILASAGCVHWGPWAIEYFANRSRKPGDPGPVVIDECAGQWVALMGLPMTSWFQALVVLAAQFFFFRLFDVIKPPPARQLERLPAGWGILMDDLAAAVYANLAGQVLLRFLIPWIT